MRLYVGSTPVHKRGPEMSSINTWLLPVAHCSKIEISIQKLIGRLFPQSVKYFKFTIEPRPQKKILTAEAQRFFKGHSTECNFSLI